MIPFSYGIQGGGDSSFAKRYISQISVQPAGYSKVLIEPAEETKTGELITELSSLRLDEE